MDHQANLAIKEKMIAEYLAERPWSSRVACEEVLAAEFLSLDGKNCEGCEHWHQNTFGYHWIGACFIFDSDPGPTQMCADSVCRQWKEKYRYPDPAAPAFNLGLNL